MQFPLVQSPLPAHISPLAHVGQVPPPQSTSVSAPFFTPSRHVGGWQMPVVQTPLVQSAATRHIFRSAHGAQMPPPQSMSVSAPFFMPSEHDEHARLQAEATSETQVVSHEPAPLGSQQVGSWPQTRAAQSLQNG